MIGTSQEEYSPLRGIPAGGDEPAREGGRGMRVGSARDGAPGHAPAEARPRVVPAVARECRWASSPPGVAFAAGVRPAMRRACVSEKGPGMGEAPGVASVATPGASPKKVLHMTEHPIIAPLSNRMCAAHCRPNVSKVVRRVAHPRRRDGPAPGPYCAKVTHIGGSPGAQLLAAIYHSSQSNVPQLTHLTS